jgi:hydrogenase/urease accessory protein HupE
VLATSLLHTAGIALGLALDRFGGAFRLHSRRLVGVTGAIAGAAILMG